MRNSIFAIIVGAMMLVSFLPAAAQAPETRGPQPGAVNGSTRSGIDIRSGLSNFVMNLNHVDDNGYENILRNNRLNATQP